MENGLAALPAEQRPRWQTVAPGQMLWCRNSTGSATYTPITLTRLQAGNPAARGLKYPGHTNADIAAANDQDISGHRIHLKSELVC